MRPAPVQIAWLGYPNTTGLDAIGYRMTDAIADPPGSEAIHSETLVRLPHGFLCYRPPEDAPDTAASQGPVTFGSFNNLSKVTAQVIACWAAILNRLPEARLILKSRSLADAPTRQTVLDAFAGHGVAAERIEALAWIDARGGHLGAYGRIDVALDPYPYNGTTTTLEALWMGVPVVALAGDRHAARVGASILATFGQDELVAADEGAYVDTAVALAQDSARRAALRTSLRPTLAASPLCDAPAFARDVEDAYRELWQNWCAARP